LGIRNAGIDRSRILYPVSIFFGKKAGIARYSDNSGLFCQKQLKFTLNRVCFFSG
jgi:hypothetical protein